MANQYGLNRYGLPEATMDMPDNNTFGLLNIKPHKRKIYNTTPVTSDPEVILPGETETETNVEEILPVNQYQQNDDRPSFDPILDRLIRGENNYTPEYENEGSYIPNATNADLISKYREYRPNLNKYTDEEITQIGLPGFEQPQQGIQGLFKNLKEKFGTGVSGIKDQGLAGLMDFLPFGDKSLSGMAVQGIQSLFERNPNAPNYQTYDPTGKVDYSQLNTTNLNDFYDSNENSDTFGTTRFDRAKPGSFASFRTLTDYFNRSKDTVNKVVEDNKKIEAQKIQDQKIQAQKIQDQKIQAQKIQAQKIQARIDAAEKKRQEDIATRDATAAAKKAASEGRAYDYSGRSNDQGTHTSTKTNQQAQNNQDRGRGQQTSAPSRSAPSRSSSYSSSRGSNFGGRFHGADGGRVDLASMFTRRR